MATVRHLGLKIFFTTFAEIQIIAYFYIDMQNLKIRQSAAELLHVYDFQNGGRPPSWIFIVSQYLSKIQISAYFYIDLQNLVKSGRSAATLLRIFNFQNGGRPSSWIWYDVIVDYLRLVFDGPNILLKFHTDRVYTLQDIIIFIFGPFGLKLPNHAPF